MQPKSSGEHGKKALRSYDLYESKDSLAPLSFSAKRDGQTMPPSDRIQQKSDLLIVTRSGWRKPAIQLGALFLLRDQGKINLHGERRIHKLLNNIRYEEVNASLHHKEKISKNPEAFGALLRWSCRPLHLRTYYKKEKRRIGVGYRDKGALPPSHLQGRHGSPENIFFLGENLEYLSDLSLHLYQMLGYNGYPPFHHEGGGWWRPLTTSERITILKKWTEEILSKV